MNLDNILMITGKPGLYEFQGKTKSGFIVKSIDTGKHTSISLQHNVSILGEIAIYTLDTEVPISSIFEKIAQKENSGKAITHKSDAKTLKSYFKEILPHYDQQRVYVSDIKKIISWYNILQEHGLLDTILTENAQKEEE